MLECVGAGVGSRKFIAPRCCTQKHGEDNESIFHMLKCAYLGIPEYYTEKEMKGWGKKKRFCVLNISVISGRRAHFARSRVEAVH